MKQLFCRCGRTVFFNNNRCENCKRQLAFDPQSMTMQASDDEASDFAAANLCANRDGPILCNWYVGDPTSNSYCLSCQTSKIIPSLNKRVNIERWRKLERAKRRLLYDLLSQGLPVDPGKLNFVFKEDQSTNPDVHEQFVTTGHANGVITINAAEADDVFREQMRKQMDEPYRTLLGHLRHESGHYFFNIVVGPDRIAEARELFGDERADYAAALQRHYDNGPQTDWWQHFVSSYAGSHPMEDWAECWAHFLHISSVLETARSQSLLPAEADQPWHSVFVDFALKLNEISRSLGLADQYPFTLSATVLRKLDFVHATVREYASNASASQT